MSAQIVSSTETPNFGGITLRDSGIGFVLWNFRGTFGVLDSGRADIAYEDWHGHKLDRRLLELLREF